MKDNVVELAVKQLTNHLESGGLVYTCEYAENGYVFRKFDQYDSPETVVKDGKGDTNSWIDFLRYIDSSFGPSSDRYNAERSHIIRLPGDKCEENLDATYITELLTLKEMIENVIKRQIE